MKAYVHGMNRRQFLQMLAIGSGGLALFGRGMPALAQATPAPPVDVQLNTSGWPIEMPIADAAPGTFQAGYARAFQTWLDLNPGVRVQQIEFNPWDAAGLRTAIAGGTAPFTYPIGVMGGWNVAGIQSAFAQGAFADITDVFNRYNVLDMLDPRVAASTSRWMAGDRIFGIPYEVVSSQGYFYNRAHLESIGMERIPMSWTWQDMREMALQLTTPDRKGLAMAAYALNWILPSYGIGFDGLVSRYPIPGRGFNWRWDFTTFVDDMVEGVELWRGMYFDDQSVFSDPNYWDFSQNGPLAAAFYDQRVSMTPGISLFFSDMAQRMNITVAEADQMMSFVRAPLGPTGFTPEQPITPSAWAFSPDLSAEQLDKGVSLFTYMLLGEGFIQTMQHIFQETGDLGAILRSLRWPYANRYSESIPGVEGSLSQAAGSNYSAALNEIFDQPRLPEVGAYIPAEVNNGPGDTPWYDKITRWAFTRDPFDVRAEAAEMESILNQQASTFASTLDENAFAEGIRRYYADWDALLQQTAPLFYEQRFRPFYELRIAPNFG
ncbi:MAG: extracellular solute-binding protein [Chloroflexi bacterium]|nr:extracellular solute-binding protein [Chloroflexota bacterium]